MDILVVNIKFKFNNSFQGMGVTQDHSPEILSVPKYTVLFEHSHIQRPMP